MSATIIRPESSDPLIVMIGAGLIGTEVVKTISTLTPGRERSRVVFDWMDASDAAKSITQAVTRELKRTCQEVEIFWCAGRAGFSASKQEMQKENQVFESVVLALKSLHSVQLVINLVSSAGGVFEGVEGKINQNTGPEALRPYGEFKLKQEDFLRNSGLAFRIYRPTGVYGLAGSAARKGLLPTLVTNTINHVTTTIHASPSTLRDYVYVGDVARVMARNAMDHSGIGKEHLIASGRPVSIYYMIRKVAQVVGRHPKVHYVRTRDNDRDIVYSADCLPGGHAFTTIEEAICLLTRQHWTS